MKIGSMFSGNYLKADDLPEGDTVKVIEAIHTATLKNNRGEEQIKPVLEFTDGEQLVLNKTNASAISRALGSDETDDWKGRKITLYTTDVEFRGDWVHAIRVKPRAPKGSAPPKDSVSDEIEDDDIPF